MKTLTTEALETLTEVANEMQIEMRSYSGRGMYGESCLAFIVNSVGEMFALGVETQKMDPVLASLLADSGCRIDTMGRNHEVVYFPSISAEGLTDEDEDEEY